ncbi:hypothetical protein X992_1794 [Burkholderia pseudomallei MSHR5492]|nr:hypothetical protein DO64_3552 [Burkholderia pseudomallei]KGS51478.1 hypothetical protein X992_1794 [Burkholderia pseudomallei MSHR5492]KGV84802.1 hypothetical protein X892_5691 [Burkholderia pseudomallei MSHR3960]KGW64116.1 hypothetical protein Y042_4552 [Burkholderia pseudomallei MSHR1357]KGX72311.1 hypothetical protein Y026_2156 [Burkholderia pseudomallei TSV28]
MTKFSSHLLFDNKIDQHHELLSSVLLELFYFC